MSLLALYLAGPVVGLVSAVVYWVGRSIERRRQAARSAAPQSGRRGPAHEEAERELLESPGAKERPGRMQEVFGRRGLTDAERRVLPRPDPPARNEAEPHIEVLKLRATKAAERLRDRNKAGDYATVLRIYEVIKSGDREALLAVMREEGIA